MPCTVESYLWGLCVVLICDHLTLDDPIELDMFYFDVIMGTDWLVTGYTSVDCRAIVVIFHFSSEPILV